MTHSQSSPLRVPIDDGTDALTGLRVGSGPTALLLHGGPALDSDQIYAPLAEELSRDFAVVRYSQRGVPPSVESPPLTVAQHVRDAITVLDYLEVSRAWLIGHSFGGYLCLEIANAHPDRVAGIISICGVGAIGDGGMSSMDSRSIRQLRWVDKLRLTITHWRHRLSRRTDRRNALWLAMSDIIQHSYFADPAKMLEVTDTRFSESAFDATVASFEERASSGALERVLPSITIPTLFVSGDSDPLRLSESGEPTAARMPNAALATVPHAGHLPWIEQPGSVASAVRSWRTSGSPAT